nr:hypothetical protein [Tanacetum cinerariifolium]
LFIIEVQTPGSGISILLAVGTPSTGSGNLYCQWELSPGSGNALCILFPTNRSNSINFLIEEFVGGLAPINPIPSGIVEADFDPEEDIQVVDDISDNLTKELYVHVPNVLPTLPTLYPVFDTLPPFSSENEDKVFNPRILASKVEKSPHLLSHRGFKAFKLIFLLL